MGMTLEALIKAGQEQAMEEKREEAGEKTDEELEKEEKKKEENKGAPDYEETKTSSVQFLANALRATSNWVTKTSGEVSMEPAPLQEAGQVPIAPPVTGEQPHPQPNPPADRDPTAEKPLGTAGTVGNTEQLPLAGETQAEPGLSTAMETGKTTSGPTKSQPLAADGAKTAGAFIRNYIKTAATPEDTQSFPGGEPAGADTTASGGEVGYTAPTDKLPQLAGDAAATNMTAQSAEDTTQKPDLKPLLATPPETHAYSGDGTPDVDSKLGAYLRMRLQGGE